MDSALLVHRLHFAFTVTFHYLFPQLTMGLAPLIVILKTLALRRNDEFYNRAANFWARIFGINFVIGVVTGIPMEFQFGTNWSHFSRFAGGVIGQTLGDGRHVCILPGVGIPRTVPLWRKASWAAGTLVVGAWRCSLGRGSADSSSSLPTPGCSIPSVTQGRRWFRPALQLLGAGPESLGMVAIRAQHERRGHHRRVRDGSDRRVLPAMGQVRSSTGVFSCASASSRDWSSAFCNSFPPATVRDA